MSSSLHFLSCSDCKVSKDQNGNIVNMLMNVTYVIGIIWLSAYFLSVVRFEQCINMCNFKTTFYVLFAVMKPSTVPSLYVRSVI